MKNLVLALGLAWAAASHAQPTKTPPPPNPSQTSPEKPKPLIVYGPTDSLFMEVEGNQRYVWHRYKEGESLYALYKFYGLQLHDLYASNAWLASRGPKLNEWIKVPLPAKAIRREEPDRSNQADYLPLFYIVKPQETLFRVAKVHFKMPVEVLCKRNKIKPEAGLKVGQALQIAWINKYGVPDSIQKSMGLTGPVAEENSKWRKQYEAKLSSKKEFKQEGVAAWPKGEKLRDHVSLYVLSNQLPMGSVVKLENPMFPRSIYAEVAGKMPENSSTEGAMLMLSPALAHALGGLDDRFFVRVFYLK